MTTSLLRGVVEVAALTLAAAEQVALELARDLALLPVLNTPLPLALAVLPVLVVLALVIQTAAQAIILFLAPLLLLAVDMEQEEIRRGLHKMAATAVLVAALAVLDH